MRFWIRDILITMFFVAVAAMYFSTQQNLFKLSVKLAGQEQQNAASRAKQSFLAAERDFIQADLDCSLQIEDVAKQIESHFPVLQEKYSIIVPRDNATVSVRQIPMLIDRKTSVDVDRIRIYVPPEISVYIKYGVMARARQSRDPRIASRLNTNSTLTTRPKRTSNSHSKRELHIDINDKGFSSSELHHYETSEERGNTWESITDYSESGPYELRLPSGMVDIGWSNQMNSQELWEMQLSLNEQTLLTTVLQIEDRCNTYCSLWAKQQLDFAADDSLPELFRSRRSDPIFSSSTASLFQVHVWLDKQSSDFRTFPGASVSK